MSKLQPVRGTHDILPEEGRKRRFITETAREIASRYGFEEFATPIFEFTDVFARTLGDVSDIVSKEMYTFTDRGGESITLRPEFTAGLARAFLSNGLQQHTPVKAFCFGPVFRYERPQKGRMRQFHQIDAEIIGVAGPQADIEVIALADHILRTLGVAPITLELNSLGDVESRKAHRAALVEYFTGHQAALSEDSKARLTKNPLRILDSKDEGDRRIVTDAPVLADYFNTASQEFFAAVKEGLTALGIAYTINPRLVRGLDYYCHTVFEFTTTALGAQNAVLAGGRYDGLMAQMGGPETPAIGWAAGIERLTELAAVAGSAKRRPVAIIPIGTDNAAMKLAQQLRAAGHTIELGYSGNLKKRMNRADKLGAVAVVILGEDELARGVATLKDLDSGAQKEVSLAALEGALEGYKK